MYSKSRAPYRSVRSSDRTSVGNIKHPEVVGLERGCGKDVHRHVVDLEAGESMEPTNNNIYVNGMRRTVPQLPLPPGFRFQPTDEELVWFYLKKKAESESFTVDVIAEVDLYKSDPWDLPEKALFGEKEWYFFSPRDRKYPNGARPNRAAASGFWKATGTDKPIHKSTVVVGVKKSLVFYKGRPPRGEKTNWIMHEYRLKEGIAPSAPHHSHGSRRLDDWVLCRIKRKHPSCATQGPPGTGNDLAVKSMNLSAQLEMGESRRTDSEDRVTDTSMQLADTGTSDVFSFPTARTVASLPMIMPGTNPFQHIANAWNHQASTSYSNNNSNNNVGFTPEFASFNYTHHEHLLQPTGTGQFSSLSFECQRHHRHEGNGSGYNNGNGIGGGNFQDSLFPYDFDDHAGVHGSAFPGNQAGMGAIDSFGYGRNLFD